MDLPWRTARGDDDSLTALGSRRAALVSKLTGGILGADGALDVSVRRAVFAGEPAPAALASYADKVRHHAYKVTDGDVEAIRRAGYSEDQIFELTVAVAVGDGYERLRTSLASLSSGASLRGEDAR
jgi:alkylhydroperoxidase family enzyme